MAIKILNGIDVVGAMNIVASDIPALDAGKITSGTFATARIPNLDASKITSGTINASRIPDLSATYAAASHSHSISNVTGLQTALDEKQPVGDYITSLTDTLATVTQRGNTTSGTINVHGNILLTGPVTTTNQGRMIDFTGFDKEGTTDFSDRAYIQHTTNTGGHAGSVLVISSQNDSSDGIAFLTHASSKLKHNSNNIATETWVAAQGYLTSATDSQTLSWNGTNGVLTISNGNSVDLDGRYAYTTHNHDAQYDSLGSANTVDTALNARIDNEVLPAIDGKQPAGTYNTIIGTDSDINTSGFDVIDNLYMTDGVITSHGSRQLLNVKIEDTRAAQKTPNDYLDYAVSFDFTDKIVSGWHSAMTLQGWTNGYAAWQIIGPSNTSTHENWYLRSGINTTWGSLRTIWHSGNLSVGDGGLTEKNFTATLKTKLDGIAANANNYSLPAGSSTVRGGFKIGYSENGKNYPVEVSSEQMYVNVPWTDTTYSVGDGGLTEKNFTSTLKTKLDGIATGANNYSLPVAGTAIGGVKSGTDITVDASGNVSVNNNSHTHLWANVTSRPTTLAGYGITDAEPLGAAAAVESTLSPTIQNAQATADSAVTAAAAAQTTADDAEALATDAKTRALDAQTAAAAAQTTADAALPKAGGTMTGELQLNARLDVGDGTNGDHEIRIYKADNNVSDHIQFYNGTTRVGEIGCEDTSWLRINQETAINIYTPRYIRADSGFFVDGTTKGIDGSGNFIGGTITGASDANVSNWDTAYTTTQSLGSAAFTSANDYAPISHTTGLTGDTYPVALSAGGFADGNIVNDAQGQGIVVQDSVSQGNVLVNGSFIQIQKNNGDFLYLQPNTFSSWTDNYTSGIDWGAYGSTITNANTNAYSQYYNLEGGGQDFFQINVSGSTIILFDQGTFNFGFADNNLKVNPATQQFSVFEWTGNNGMYFSPVTATLQVPDVTIVSDRNAKENIEEITSGLDVVCKLQGVEYDMKSTKHHASGFIAQDVQEVIPHAVVETETGLTMKYNSIIAYQNEAIKELKAMVDELKEELKTLKNG